MHQEIKDSVLVRGVNWIGDAVMTMPALRALRKVYPESHISLLVKPSVAPIFENDPNIDRIILYEDHFNGVIGKFRLAQRLRKMCFSKAVLFQNAFDAALITFLAGIPERIGYDRDGRGSLLTKQVLFNDDDRKLHHIDYYLNIIFQLRTPNNELRTMNSDSNPPLPPFIKGGMGGFVPWIYLSLDERVSARDKLSQLRRPILGINPGATYGSAKRWFPERFAEVANWFVKDTGGSVVLFGGHSEVAIAEEICKYSNKLRVTSYERESKEYSEQNSSLVTRHSLLNLAGKTNLRELIALTSECDVFVSNDSGPMHIAYAVKTPLVAIFGSTSPELTGPVGNGNMVIKSDIECSPCFERACKNRNNNMGCMYNVTSEDVFFAVNKILPTRKAVFFDRDGTLCRDVGYLNNWSDFEVFPDIGNLKDLKDNGLLLIGISNQSGIARGIVDESFAKEVNQTFMNKYGFDDFYYCPHHPDEHCSCRKPEPQMLFEARAKYKINLKESYVVGDKDSDMLLAKAVGAKGILVLTGQQTKSGYADFIAENLRDVVDLILRDSNESRI